MCYMLEVTHGSEEKSLLVEGGILLRHIRSLASTASKFATIKAIGNEGLRTWLAHHVFGDKLAGDLGLRTTAHHPKTDYGDAHFNGYFGLAEK